MENQILSPSKYIFCVNNKEEWAKYKDKITLPKERYLVVEFSENVGVWARFFLAFNAETDLIYICDDDVIAGKKRLENGVKALQGKEMIV